MGKEGRDLIQVIVTFKTGSGPKLAFCLLSPSSPPPSCPAQDCVLFGVCGGVGGSAGQEEMSDDGWKGK